MNLERNSCRNFSTLIGEKNEETKNVYAILKFPNRFCSLCVRKKRREDHGKRKKKQKKAKLFFRRIVRLTGLVEAMRFP